MKEFRKLVNIWRSYGQDNSGSFFTHITVCVYTELKWLYARMRVSYYRLLEVQMKFSGWFTVMNVADDYAAHRRLRPLPAHGRIRCLDGPTDAGAERARWVELMMWMNQVTSASETDSRFPPPLLRRCCCCCVCGSQLGVMNVYVYVQVIKTTSRIVATRKAAVGINRRQMYSGMPL